MLAWLWRNRITYFSWTDAIKPFAAPARETREVDQQGNFLSAKKFMVVILPFVLELEEQNERLFMLQV
jgi:hypothetical protein